MEKKKGWDGVLRKKKFEGFVSIPMIWKMDKIEKERSKIRVHTSKDKHELQIE